ncbi:MAG TPA: DUF2486 family protein [Paraburkholderia sp.]
MSDPNDDSIPVLHEVLVPGHAVPAQPASSDSTQPDVPREPGFRTEPSLTPQQEPAQQPAVAAEPAVAPEPVHAPEETAHAPHPADPHHPKKRSRAHHAAEPRHAHGGAHAPSAGVFDRVEPAAPLEAGAIVPPDIVHESAVQVQASFDADVIAERLRGRFAGFLTGEGRGIIEAHSRAALQEHTTWLVNQITREVALTLESEMTGWVREAVEAEIARRSGHS